jgi:periplasmic protein TonB
MTAQQLTLDLEHGVPWERRAAAVIPLSLAAHAAAVALLAVAPLLSPELPPIAHPPGGFRSPAPEPITRAPRVDLTKLAQSVQRRSPARKTSAPQQLPTSLSTRPVYDPLDADTGTQRIIPGALPCLENCEEGDDRPQRETVVPDPFPKPTPKPQYVRISSYKPPAKLDHVAPVYPELACKARIQGTVTVECTIAPTGRVENAIVTDGPPLLREAAVEAVRQWRYTPTLIGGVEVGVLLTVHVNFRLQ